MARRSLRPQLNQIRAWVRQGRTDAWIAHQLEVSVKDIDGFKNEHGLTADDGEVEERDLRAEDDALVAAELDAVDEEDEDEDEESGDEAEGDADADAENGDKPKRRRRGRRGGRRRRGARGPLEGTFDHGEEGYGLWLDPAVQDDGVYAEHWAGHRPVTVTIEPDRIVITRTGDEPDDAGDEDDS